MKNLFFINEEIRNYNKVIIYGAGWAGHNMLFKLLQANVQVACIADSNPDKCGQRFLNIPIVHIDTLVSERDTAAVIVSGRYASEVARELEKRGFAHIFFDHGNDVGVVHMESEG